MRSKLLSVVFCVLAFAMTMIFVIHVINPSNAGQQETKETLPVESTGSDVVVLPTVSTPAPLVTAQTVSRVSKELEETVARLYLGADKTYAGDLTRLSSDLADCSVFARDTLSDPSGSAYLNLLSGTLREINETPFADNSSFSVRMSAILRDIAAAKPQNLVSGEATYPDIDTDPNGTFAAAMLSVYRQQAGAGVFTVTVGGKLVLADPVTDPSSPFDTKLAQQGENYPLAPYSPILSTDGLSIVNLGNVLTDSVAPASDKAFSAIRGKTSYAALIKNAGIDLAILGGSHTDDFGEEGITSTSSALSGAGVGSQTFASGSSAFDTPVGKVAVLSYDASKATSAMINGPKEDIAKAKADGAVVVIALFARTTTDKELNAVDGVMTKTGRGAIDSGADLVVFATQSAIQGASLYKGKYIVYSPAVTFASADGSDADDGTGFFVQQTFSLNGDQLTSSKLSVIPVSNGKDGSAPRLLLDASGEAVVDRIVKFSDTKKYIGDGVTKTALDYILIQK